MSERNWLIQEVRHNVWEVRLKEYGPDHRQLIMFYGDMSESLARQFAMMKDKESAWS